MWILLGILMMLYPFFLCFMTTGELTNEAFEKMIFGLSFEQSIRLSVAVRFGGLMFLYGMLRLFV